MLAQAPLPAVRVALPADEDDIMDMCRRLHAENGLFELNESKVKNCLKRFYNKMGVSIAVIGPPGKLEGSICLMVTDMYYTDDWHLAELWNFVDEPFRRSRNAESLIVYAKRCADAIELPLITGVITNKRMAEKVRLYRRLLGYPAGAFFVYNGKWKSAAEPTAEDFWKPFESRTDKRKREREERRNGS